MTAEGRMAGVRKTLTRVLTVAGAIALLLLIFRVVPFGDVMRSIRSAEPGKLAVGFALLFLGRLLAAWRMKLLTDEQGLRLRLTEIFEIGTTSTFYGLILPGTLSGGLVRWYKLAKQGNAVGALTSLTWDRLADTAAVGVIGILGWGLSRPAGAHGVIGPGLLGVSAALVALYVAGFSRSVGNVVLRPIDAAVRRLREGVLILLLRPYGVTGADAVALSFIQLGGTFILAILGGIFEFRSFWRRRAEPVEDSDGTPLASTGRGDEAEGR